MSARISSSAPSRNPLTDSLQQPTPGDYSNSFSLLSHDPMPGAETHVNNSALLQRFGLGPKRMDPYSQVKPNNMGAYPSVFGGGESPLMNTINSAADARSAKVKSDLLMGLNAGIRPDRQIIKDPHPHRQQQPTLSFSEEHASILGNLNSRLQTSAPAVNNQFGDANNGSGYSAVTGDYSSHPSSHHEGFNVNGLYGTNLMISLPMSSAGTGAMSTAGPPPGLSPHPDNDFNSTSVSAGSADNGGSGMAPSFLGGNLNTINPLNPINPINPTSDTNSSIVRPLDIASMMNTLDFFGPSPASPVPSSVNNAGSWSLPPYGAGLGEGHMYHQETANGSSHDGSEMLSRRVSIQSITGSHSNGQHHHHQLVSDGSALSNDSSTAQSKPSQGNVSSPGTPGSASTRSVEDLELQVINAKMETQMLENQLNAVIKRNRRKLYA
ncbi:hypothetical protein BGX34_010496 [Mortierella sp. NVP85]|nr:hypothetical protein BGX34_010496 [Mortierella sp. NVP85]